MRGTLVAFLAICQTLVFALPSGGKEDLVPVAHRGVVERQPVGSSWTTPSYCAQTTDAGGFASVYSALVGESTISSFDYSTLCSQVIQSTSIAIAYTTASGVLTDTYTNIITTAVSSTSTDVSRATTTVLCAKPAPSQQCGIKANGYSNYWMSQQWITAEACNQLCLSTESCKSFQNVPNQAPDGVGLIVANLCNLYSANVSMVADTYDSSVATMYDRDCPDLLPAHCSRAAPSTTSVSSAHITPAPSSAKVNAALEKRGYTVPPFLSTYVPGEEILYLYLACSCLITEGPPAVIVTQTNVVQTFVSVTTTTTQTLLYPFVTSPNMHTKYKTVS